MSTETRRIEYLDLDDIELAVRNPKAHDTEGIKRSISHFGLAEVPTLDGRTGRLVAGHGRIQDLRDRRTAGEAPPNGVTANGDRWLVPVLCGWASRSDEDAEAYLVASNNLSSRGGWDDAELGALLADLNEVDPELLALTGFTDEDLAALLEEEEDEEGSDGGDDDEPGPPPDDPVTVHGDLWLLGPHRVLCGDSTEVDALGRVMEGELADLIWTDPPYNAAVTGGTHDPRDTKNHGKGPRIKNDSMADAEFRDFLASAFSAMWAFARDGAAIYVCHADSEGINFRTTFRDAGFFQHEILIWVKQEFVFGRKDYHWQHEPILYGWKPGTAHSFYGERNQSTTWSIDRPMRSDMEHPTQKPVALVAKALSNSSQVGEVVLDPFGGGGSTLVACHERRRLARLVELDPRYVDVICRRWEKLTGIVPILESTGEQVSFVGEA